MTTGIVRPVVTDATPRLTDTAVLVSHGGDCDRLRRRLGFAGAPGRRLMLSRLYHEPGRWSVAGPVMGAAYVAMLVETLMAWGVQRIIYFGWCGAIAPTLRIGDRLVATGAWVDEGTSPHYGTPMGECARPASAWSDQLRSGMDDDGGRDRLHSGAVWTTDAIFRETPEQVQRFRAKGAVAVEMEASAVMSVTRSLGGKAAVALVVSDSLADLVWRPGFKHSGFKESRTVLIDAIAALAGTATVSGNET